MTLFRAVKKSFSFEILWSMNCNNDGRIQKWWKSHSIMPSILYTVGWHHCLRMWGRKEKRMAVWVKHRPHITLNYLCRSYFFISSTYENNQQQAHKAAHRFLHPICSDVKPPQKITHLISPWISRHDWAVLCEIQHQDGLMGLEIYAGTIWAALAFKLQSSGEMGNNNCIKIKKNLQLTITVRNWPRVLALTGRCCTAWSPAVIRMWEQAVPTHWAHQASPTWYVWIMTTGKWKDEAKNQPMCRHSSC